MPEQLQGSVPIKHSMMSGFEIAMLLNITPSNARDVFDYVDILSRVVFEHCISL